MYIKDASRQSPTNSQTQALELAVINAISSSKQNSPAKSKESPKSENKPKQRHIVVVNSQTLSPQKKQLKQESQLRKKSLILLQQSSSKNELTQPVTKSRNSLISIMNLQTIMIQELPKTQSIPNKQFMSNMDLKEVKLSNPNSKKKRFKKLSEIKNQSQSSLILGNEKDENED